MTLSEEIQQANFDSPHTEAILGIHFTSNWLFRAGGPVFQAFDISHEQYNILRILRGNRDGAYCLRDIQDRMLNRTANTTRLVEKLRQRGLLTRETNPDNRRMVDIRITQAGLDLLAEMDEPIAEFGRRVKAALTEEEARQLSGLLDRLRSGFDGGPVASQPTEV